MRNYNPKEYWESRLKENFSLRGVGHIDFSERYNYWLYKRKKRCLELFFSNYDIESKHVLDIGCGTGFFIQWFLEQNALVTGIDITTTSINNLKRTFDANFLVQDITASSLKLPISTFDILNMWDVIYHIVDTSKFERAIHNISNLAAPGALFVFTDWFGLQKEEHKVADHVLARNLDTYSKVLPGYGFDLVAVFPLYHYLNKSIIGRLDAYFGRLYYELDNRITKISNDNLSVSVWKKL